MTIRNNVGPYFPIKLTTQIDLQPHQMNKMMEHHLLENLIKIHQNKCFESYGYIYKIFNKLDLIEGGKIVAENFTSAATYKIMFRCNLCRPLRGTTIVGEITKINKSLICILNGPIQIIIMQEYDGMSKKNFLFDENRNVYVGHVYDSNGKITGNIPIIEGTFVNVICKDVRIENDSSSINVFGFMDSLSTTEEINESIKQRELGFDKQHDGEDKFIDYETFIKNKEKYLDDGTNETDNDIANDDDDDNNDNDNDDKSTNDEK